MMRSPAEWLMDLMIEDESVYKLLDFCTDAGCQFIRLMVDTGIDLVSNGDSMAGPDMISPEMYTKFALPYEKKLVEEAKKYVKPYMLHICGNTDSILNNIVETGTDALELDFKTNIRLINDVCKKNHITFSGNIDPSGVLALGTPKMVEEETKKILDFFKDNPRLIINAGCAIPSETPSENIKKLIEVTRNHI
jgi:uroporphyrinogen decarboxylase